MSALSTSVHSPNQIFFVYDHTILQKEEDDLKDAIIYFSPPSVKDDDQCALCGQLMGMVSFFNVTWGAKPHFYQLTTRKFAVLHVEVRYTLALGTDNSVSDHCLEQQLKLLYDTFTMYMGSLEAIRQDCESNQRSFSETLQPIWECFLPFCCAYGDDVRRGFFSLPVVDLPKSAADIFLEASCMLQASKTRPGVLGGVVVSSNGVLCTQLSEELTSRFLVIKPQQNHLPCQQVQTDFPLPVGVRIINVHISQTEYAKLIHRPRSTVRHTRTTQFRRNHQKPSCDPPPYSFEEGDSGWQSFQRSQQTSSNFDDFRTQPRMQLSNVLGLDCENFVVVDTELSMRKSSKHPSHHGNQDNNMQSIGVKDSIGVQTSDLCLKADISYSAEGESSEDENFQFVEKRKRSTSQIISADVHVDASLSQRNVSASDNIPGLPDNRENADSTVTSGVTEEIKTTTSECSQNMKIPENAFIDVKDVLPSNNVLEKKSETNNLKELSEVSGNEIILEKNELHGNATLQTDLSNDGTGQESVVPSSEDVASHDRSNVEQFNCSENLLASGSVVPTEKTATSVRPESQSCDIVSCSPPASDDTQNQSQKSAGSQLTTTKTSESNSLKKVLSEREFNSPNENITSKTDNPAVKADIDTTEIVDENSEKASGQQLQTTDLMENLSFLTTFSADSAISVSSDVLSEDAVQSIDEMGANLEDNCTKTESDAKCTTVTVSNDSSYHGDENVSHVSSSDTTSSPRQDGKETFMFSTQSSEKYPSDFSEKKIEAEIMSQKRETLPQSRSHSADTLTPGSRNKAANTNSVGMKNLTLYIQGHSDSMMILLLEEEARRDRQTILALCKQALPQLGDLDFKVKDLVSTDLRRPAHEDYYFLKYNDFQRQVSGNVTKPVAIGEIEFCDMAIDLHEEFRKSGTLTEVSARTHRSGIYAHRSVNHEVYFQSTIRYRQPSVLPFTKDVLFSLDQIARKKLYKNHNITLL